jgi:Spy/CpxP family protein refolding chaperone
MRTLKWVLVFAVLAVWVAPARPGEEIVPVGTTVQLLLLRQKSVQKELKLTAATIKKILDFTNEESEAYKKALKLKEKQRETTIEGLEKKNRKFLEDNLTEAQRKRLRQITLQVSGLQQLTRPDVARVLSLTKEQRNQFAKMRKEARKKLAEILNAKKGTERAKKLAMLREEIDKKIGEVLTDKQKEKVKELVGERFKGELVLEDPD